MTGKKKKRKKKKNDVACEISIQIAEKLLPVNINNIETSKEYASGAKVVDLATNLDYIPPSLSVFCCCCCRGRKYLKSEELLWIS